MAAEGTGLGNTVGVVAKSSRVDHIHKLLDHDHTGDAGDGAQIVLGSMAAGIFTANATGRGKFAAGIFTKTELAAAALEADATGRLIMATDFFDAATAEDKFEDSSIPSDKVNWAFGAAATVIQPDASAATGSAITPARSDHVHGIVGAAPVDGSLAAANAEGASTSFARANHAHRLVVADSVEIEFGTGYDAVMGWEVGDGDNETLVLGLADANQALHISDKSAIGTDWNVGADTHPSVYIHSDTTPATDYLKLSHDATNGRLAAVGGTLDLTGVGEVSVNVDGADVNFRVETVNEDNIFFVDAALDVAHFGAVGNAAKFLGISSTARTLGSAAEYAGLHIEPAGAVTTNGDASTSDHIASAYFAEPNITNGGGDTITVAATVFIKDAPDEGATNSALYVAAGTINPVGGISFGTNPASAGNIRLPNNAAVWLGRNAANGADITGWKVNAEDDYEAAADVNLGGNTLLGATAANGDLTLTATSNGTKTTSYILPTEMVDVTTNSIAIRVKAGAIGDGETAQTDLNGEIGLDSANGRFYFRYGAAWHYVAQTAGFVIPDWEVKCPACSKQMKPGQDVIGVLDGTQEDGALHGVWKHKTCPK